MCFHNADYDLTAVRLFLPRGLQHGVGLAHARRHPEKNLQSAATSCRLLALHLREKRIRIRPFGLTHEAILLTITVRANQIKDHGRGDGQPCHRSMIATGQRVHQVGGMFVVRMITTIHVPQITPRHNRSRQTDSSIRQ
jgi:hypothetical protein